MEKKLSHKLLLSNNDAIVIASAVCVNGRIGQYVKIFQGVGESPHD